MQETCLGLHLVDPDALCQVVTEHGPFASSSVPGPHLEVLGYIS